MSGPLASHSPDWFSRAMLDETVVAAILQRNTRDDLAEYLDGLDDLPCGVQRWDAVTKDGRLRVPDDEHFLEAMITSCELEPEMSRRSFSGRSGVAALIWQRPICDMCNEEVARYDAEVVPMSAWGNMCEGCYRMNSRRVLGLGVGQYLFSSDELAGSIRVVVDHIAAVCWPDS